MSIKVDDVEGSRQIRIYQRRTSIPLVLLAIMVSVYAGALLRFFPAYREHPPDAAVLVGGIPMILLLAFSTVMANKKWFGGYQRVTVTPSTMEVESRLLGFTTSRHQYMNQAVRKLRYEEWYPQTGRALARARTHGVRFEYDGVTQAIAVDAESADCMDLIDRMIEVFSFSTAPSSEPEMATSLFP
ncbi:MAG TPA: hypothetical protein VHE33_12205 [Acidobacteriaceae bacterium]|nr:hypothetical protein [Acidobacteriaceae bacterium]